jgi:hypothetical protein
MSAIAPCFTVVIALRWRPTRREIPTKSGSRASEKSASRQSSRNMATIVAMTVVRFDAIDVAVLVTTVWTPPMSLAMRDCTSPVRVRVKKASDMRWRCRNTCERRSCITRWPTRFDSQVWPTPMIPVTTATAIIPPTSHASSVVSRSGIASSRTSRSRKGETMPTIAETTIMASTVPSRSR